MKRYLLKLLLWLYRKALRDFVKISVADEFEYYKFKTPQDVIKLLKYLQTTQMLWYYEAKTKQEQDIVKGASIILKILVDSHNEAMEIIEHCPDENKQIEYWERHKKKNRTN